MIFSIYYGVIGVIWVGLGFLAIEHYKPSKAVIVGGFLSLGFMLLSIALTHLNH